MSAILPLQNPPRFRGGFETIVTPLLGRDGQPLAESEWRGGVTGETMPLPTFFKNGMAGGSWGDPDDGGTKPLSSAGDEAPFLPSSVGIMFNCGMNAPNTARGDVVMAHARSEMRRSLWTRIASHVHSDGSSIMCDPDDDGNPTLMGSAKTPPGFDDGQSGALAGVIHGLLEAACNDQMHADLVFLAPRFALPHAVKSGLVKWDEAVGAYVLLGTHRIAFDCIANDGPEGTTTAADGSEAWLYMMLPPQADVAEEGDGDVVAVRNNLLNDYTVRAERQFAYWFDPTRVYAAKFNVNGCAA